ncbi:MAG: glycine--tRNA ligase subunit beta, partial [bacterium]
MDWRHEKEWKGKMSWSIAMYGTPRRLALLVKDLVEKQEDLIQEVVGPPARAAFTPDGKPTPAATGFAAAQGGKVDDLKVRTTPKGEYVVFTRKQAGQAAEAALPEILLGILKGLSFPKSMTWEPSGFRFIRPIRSLGALFGTKALKLSVAGVKSGRDTAGLFPTDRRRLSLPTAGRYVELLRIRHVLVDPAVRREQVDKLVNQAARRVGAVRPDGGLVDEVAAMVEYPSAVLGGFDPSHLHLPEEILVTCLRHHQKFFAVQDGRGRLVAHFVGVKNGISEHLETVREGYERVLAARLADAAFYWTQDGKLPLAQQAQKLSAVVFQEGLGTLADKAVRVDHLA